jgi:hypothetical protein
VRELALELRQLSAYTTKMAGKDDALELVAALIGEFGLTKRQVFDKVNDLVGAAHGIVASTPGASESYPTRHDAIVAYVKGPHRSNLYVPVRDGDRV